MIFHAQGTSVPQKRVFFLSPFLAKFCVVVFSFPPDWRLDGHQLPMALQQDFVQVTMPFKMYNMGLESNKKAPEN